MADRSAHAALRQARLALERSDRRAAWAWARQAARADPALEEPWLILAGLAKPADSLKYVHKALACRPNSPRALKALAWAEKRQASPVLTDPGAEAPQTAAPRQPPARPAPPQRTLLPWAWLSFVVILPLATLLSFPGLSLARSLLAEELAAAPAWASAPPVDAPPSLLPQAAGPTAEAISPAPTEPTFPTPTATFTPPPSHTPPPLPTFTAVSTLTSSPTPTPTPVILLPTEPPLPAPPTEGPDDFSFPEGLQPTQKWIDVDLSQQKTYAFIGAVLVRSFLVSTGTSKHPTVTGQYQIYLKYRTANMRGAGYFLKGVPYVMYFYESYGLHGTTWHSNFGTPMSHGCVNLSVDDARWLYEWAPKGTLVNIHP